MRKMSNNINSVRTTGNDLKGYYMGSSYACSPKADWHEFRPEEGHRGS